MRPAPGQLVIVFVVAALLLASPVTARQQKDQQPSAPSAPAAGESSSRPAGAATATAPPATKPADAGTYDPVSAQDDIDVGMFYLHKGDIDAAISRFQDAIRLRSNFAKPRLLLAEAYEKKGDKASELKYYKEYLQVYPKAPDAKKIQSKIEKLSGE